jgi:hypothetical protein
MLTLTAALFLIAHAAIHLGFLAPPPAAASGPSWPFALDGSRLLGRLGLGRGGARRVGVLLVMVLVAAYLGAALALAGMAPWTVVVRGVVVGSIVSATLLTLFFHRWLSLGVLIDVGLLAFVASDWRVTG